MSAKKKGPAVGPSPVRYGSLRFTKGNGAAQRAVVKTIQDIEADCR